MRLLKDVVTRTGHETSVRDPRARELGFYDENDCDVKFEEET